MSDPPNEPDHLERFLRSVDALRTDAIKRVRRLTSDPAAERAIRTIRDEILERAPRVIRAAQQASERFRRAFEDALPSNWKELEDDQVFAAVELMAGTGWSLLWTPGPAVVVAILVAEDANARRAALLKAEDEVLRDVDQMLAGIDTEEARLGSDTLSPKLSRRIARISTRQLKRLPQRHSAASSTSTSLSAATRRSVRIICWMKAIFLSKTFVGQRFSARSRRRWRSMTRSRVAQRGLTSIDTPPRIGSRSRSTAASTVSAP